MDPLDSPNVLASTVFIGHRPGLESYSFASGICLEKTWAASPLRAALIFPGLYPNMLAASVHSVLLLDTITGLNTKHSQSLSDYVRVVWYTVHPTAVFRMKDPKFDPFTWKLSRATDLALRYTATQCRKPLLP